MSGVRIKVVVVKTRVIISDILFILGTETTGTAEGHGDCPYHVHCQ